MSIAGNSFVEKSNSLRIDAVMEILEERLLLTTGPIVIGDGVGANAKSLVYTDGDGTVVTVSFTSGNANISFTDENVDWNVSNKGVATLAAGTTAEIDIITLLNGTTDKSSLTFKTARPKNADPEVTDLYTSVKEIFGNGLGIGQINASCVNLLGVDVGDGPTGIDLDLGAKTVSLHNVESGTAMFFGAAAVPMTFQAAIVDSVKLQFAGTLTKLTVQDWTDQTGNEEASIEVNAAGQIVVSNGNLGIDVNATAGNIDGITVIGGNLIGSLKAVNGCIGNITVTGVATYDKESETGIVTGGSILSEEIFANQVKGKSIGNITLTAGSFGADGQPVKIRTQNGDEARVTGIVGNVIAKSLRYKESVTEEEVLDKEGNPKEDKDGNPITKMVTNYAYQGGGIWTDLDIDGKLSNLTTSGGDLGGTVHAKRGMGDVKIETILIHQKGTASGIPYTDDETDILQANLTASLSAEVDVNVIGIKSISVNGGNITGNVNVTGTIGSITTKCVGVGTVIIGESGLDTITFDGGRLESETFHASGIGNISLGGGDLSGNVISDNSIGTITVTLAGLTGSVTATNGSVSNITLKGAAYSFLDSELVNFSGTVIAGQSIGNVLVEGGNMTGFLTAQNSIGSIAVKALTVNAAGKWVNYSEEGDKWSEFESTDSTVFGGQFEVTITLGETGSNANATLGAITGTGVEVTVNGTVPWDPADTKKVKITCTQITYISSVDGEETTDDEGNVTGHKIYKNKSYLPDCDPGDFDPTNYIHNNLILVGAE